MPSAVKLLLDENLSWRVARGLSAAGYQVTTAAAAALQSAPDAAIFEFARRQGYTLVTRDSDFLNHFPPPHSGILVVQCPSDATNAVVLNCLLAQLPGVLTDDLRDEVRVILC